MELSNHEKKAIRDIKYEIHCHEITISQPSLQDGHLLKGHGKIKQNSSGMLILEFICLESRHPLGRSGSIPEDFAIEEQTVYLEALSINLRLIKSKKLYFETDFIHAINPGPNFYKIPLQYIEFEHSPYSDAKDYSSLIMEFHGKSDIPPNKKNTISYSNGSISLGWNETIFSLLGSDYSIKEKEGYTKVFIRYPHEADVEKIKEALLFYICISTGRLIQPYFCEIKTKKDHKTCIDSFNEKILYTKMPRSIDAWMTDKNRKHITKKHYVIFKNILLILLIKPEVIKSINAQWRRIWQGFDSPSIDITMLALTISIEGILNDIYIQHIEESLSCNKFEIEREFLIKKISSIESINPLHLESLTKSILNWGKVYPAKALSYLHEQGLITSKHKKDWNDLRNSSAHPRLSQQNQVAKLKRRRRITSCYGLFYRLLFNILEYRGPQYSFDDSKSSERYPYIRVLPDLGLNDHEITTPGSDYPD